MTKGCSDCWQPGECCRRIRFFGGGEMQTAGENEVLWRDSMPIDDQIRQYRELADEERPQPFNLVSKGVELLGTDGTRRFTGTFTCRNLLANGRCGDYENRPELCRDQFAPAKGFTTCIHYLPQEGGEG